MQDINEDFNLFNEKDRQNISYRLCLGGNVGLGIMVGSWVPVVGSLVGAASGFAVGLMACKKLSPVIEKNYLHMSPFQKRSLRKFLKLLKSKAMLKPSLMLCTF